MQERKTWEEIGKGLFKKPPCLFVGGLPAMKGAHCFQAIKTMMIADSNKKKYKYHPEPVALSVIILFCKIQSEYLTKYFSMKVVI